MQKDTAAAPKFLSGKSFTEMALECVLNSPPVR